ncbi:NADPH-dependent F420 reductase [Methanocaldococcus infernus]|uniref:NADPH-dependent F420 reductase n=1 Tax=Methanocaldococcus infernus (strain DSM 11812 / JCM 15783 / ME) TaxID=573063 RepID=D5VSQ2_METIM|nr:NADPH-dependent F420 reductase [Methanocaldococcus infernus]ADG13605.1 NADPH-dependent F420 reductase [Methanocaldococcus infernus ME]
MKISIIGGTGEQGFALALRLLIKGFHVIIGSRSEEKALMTVEEIKKILGERLKGKVEGKNNIEAAKEGDVVVLSIPYEYTIPTIKALKDELKGKIVISMGVPLATAIGDKPTRLLYPPDGSVAEMVQNILKESKVVGALQNVSNKVLRDIEKEVDCDILITGDDEEAKRVVKEILEKIDGVRVIDCGDLEKSRIVESITALLIALNIKYKAETGIRITNLKI